MRDSIGESRALAIGSFPYVPARAHCSSDDFGKAERPLVNGESLASAALLLLQRFFPRHSSNTPNTIASTATHA